MSSGPSRATDRGSWRRTLRRWRRRLKYGRYAPLVRRVVLYGGAVALLAAVVWLVVTGLLAKQQLTRLQGRVDTVKALIAAGRIDDARHAAADIPAMARDAHRLTTGPAWWVAAHVPYLGDPVDVVRGTTSATEQLGTDAIPQLVDVATRIDPTALRAAGNTIRVAPLAAAAPRLVHAASALDRISADAHHLDHDTWLSYVDDKRAALVGQLDSIRGYVDAAARVARVLPDMLGQHGTKRYFLGLQNEAELRGTGGLPGAFAIAEVTDGRIHFTRFASDQVLLPAKTRQRVHTGLDFGRQYDALYGASEPTATFPDSNVSPHFPYAARIWAAMWEKVGKQRIDGVLAVDPTVLGHFLQVTGPAALGAGGQVVNAQNVVALTQKDNYALFADNAQRKAFLVAILRAAANKITSGAGTPFGLLQAASQSGREQRLLVWTRDPRLERLVAQTDFAGAIPSSDRPLSALILNNAASGKLDYYLQRSLDYVRTGCGSRRDVTATIELRNDAPAAGLPPYVTTRLDRAPPDAKPGDSRVLLDYYATKGALLESVSLNGRRATAAADAELGHAVFRMDVELPRGSTQTIVLHLNEPAGSGRPRIWQQPGVTPLAVQELDQSCG